MDVLQLIDRLEQLVSAGRRMPLTSMTIIDEQEFLDIVDQLRVTVPEEIKQARRVSQERERVMLQADAEAEKIINAAREQAARLLQDDELIRRAQEEAERLLSDAEREAESIRRGADEYAADVLAGLESELARLLATTRKGRATLDRSLHRSEEDHAGEPTV
jgi:cell division septum initiation protein DivIVA